jgi:hypothetical protein
MISMRAKSLSSLVKQGFRAALQADVPDIKAGL